MSHVYALSTGFFEQMAAEYADRPGERRLAECIDLWIKEGDIIAGTGGDYAVFLKVVVTILVRIHEGDTNGLHFERPLLDDLSGAFHCSVDRDSWESEVFKWKYGRAIATGSTA